MESLFVQQVFNGLIVGSVYCLIAIGLTMIFGVMKISNFAHGDFSMLGAYFAIYFIALISGWTGWLGSLIIAAIGVGIIGFFVERFLFRPLLSRWTDIDIIMISIGLFILLENGARLLFGTAPKMIPDPFGSKAVNLLFFSTSWIRLFCFLFSCIAIFTLQLFLTKTKMGVAIRATSQNRNAALLMGINISSHLLSHVCRGIGAGRRRRRSLWNHLCRISHDGRHAHTEGLCHHHPGRHGKHPGRYLWRFYSRGRRNPWRELHLHAVSKMQSALSSSSSSS